MSTKKIIIAGAVIAAGFVAWKWYQKNKAQAAPTTTVINNQAPADSTSSTINSAVAGVTSIVNLFGND